MKSALVLLLLFALPLAGLVAGCAHALGAGPLVETATFAGMAAVLFYIGIKGIDAVASGEKVPRSERQS